MTFNFYESAYDALEKSIAISGKTRKAIAEAVYPGRQIETAKSLLSRALSPENNDVHVNLENLQVIIKETRPDDFIFWMCDLYGFERPEKKTSDKLKKEMAADVKEIHDQLNQILRKMPK